MVKVVFVRFASMLLTMLERVQSMGLNLLNQLDNDDEEPPVVHGCRDCRAIFHAVAVIPSHRLNVYCPSCGKPNPQLLGILPGIVEDVDGQVFLMGEDGFTTGPYPSAETAQQSLWDWFERKEHDEQKAKLQGRRKVVNLRKEALAQDEEVRD